MYDIQWVGIKIIVPTVDICVAIPDTSLGVEDGQVVESGYRCGISSHSVILFVCTVIILLPSFNIIH